MPILPREIKRGIEKKQRPDRQGEEGYVTFVQSNSDSNIRYAAKQMYMCADKRRLYPPAHEGEAASDLSPFWFKAKKYEYDLIQSAFPDITIKMVAAYDERISKNEEGELEFHFREGHPTLVSEEVVGDPELITERDAILGPTYDHMLGYHQDTVHGNYATEGQRQDFYRIIAEADVRLTELFKGVDMQIYLEGPYNATNEPIPINPHTAAQIDQVSRLMGTDTELNQFWDHGIIAIHPEFNYIPEGADADTGVVHGKFIELTIFDLHKLADRLSSRLPATELKKLQSKTDRYQLFRMLDSLFDRAVPLARYKRNNHLKERKAVISAIYRIFEALRDRCDTYNIFIVQQFGLDESIQQALEKAFEQAGSEEELVEFLNSIRDNVKAIELTPA